MQKYCQLLTGGELVIVLKVFNTLFTQRKNYLDCDLDLDTEDASVYTEHSLYNKDHHIIVASQLPNIWIKIIQLAIQMKCLHGTKDLDPDHFAPCKQHITDLVYGRCLIL